MLQQRFCKPLRVGSAGFMGLHSYRMMHHAHPFNTVSVRSTNSVSRPTSLGIQELAWTNGGLCNGSTMSGMNSEVGVRFGGLRALNIPARQALSSPLAAGEYAAARRYYTKFNAGEGRQQQRQHNQQNSQRHKLTSLYLTRKHYFLIGTVLFAGVCLFIHYFFPDHSLIDYFFRYIVYGGPYRDYNMLTRGVFLDKIEDESNALGQEMSLGTEVARTMSEEQVEAALSTTGVPRKIYVPNEMHFEIGIPEHFVYPGLVLTEDTTYKTKGWFSMTDELKQNLFVEWKDIMQQLTENEQTKYTPMDELLKGSAFMYVKELKDTLGESNVHVQRTEYISMTNMDQHLAPIPALREDERFGDMVCVVDRIHNPYKKEDKWEGNLWFLHTPYVFHIRLTYPKAFVQMGEEENVEAALQNFASRISRNPEFQQQIVSKVKATSDPQEISSLLRDALTTIYLKNKFKRHGAVEVRTIPKKKEDKKEESSSKKKGWFW